MYTFKQFEVTYSINFLNVFIKVNKSIDINDNKITIDIKIFFYK